MTIEQVTAEYQRQYGALRATTIAQAIALWQAYGGVTQDDEEQWLSTISPLMSGAQRAIGALVTAYFQQALREVGLTPRRTGVGGRDYDTESLRGTDSREVFRRPVVTARTGLSQGKSFDESMELAEQRTEQISGTNAVMAQRRAALRAVEDDERIVGVRRVLTGQSCMFCAVASTQRYTVEAADEVRPETSNTGQLQRVPGLKGGFYPLHVACDCGLAPIIGSFDPGRVINDDLLERLQRVGGAEYWKRHGVGIDENGVIRERRIEADPETGRKRSVLGEPLEVAVREHGELGPVLTNARHSWTGPDDIGTEAA